MSKPRRKAPKLDSISNLPSDIVENILAFLPIKDAVRTSILSTKWRYKSAMLQTLKFDERCVSTQKDTTFANIVDQVLLLHNGPIHKFVLSHRDFSATAAIDRWVLYLSRSSVKHLKLKIWKGFRYKLPSTLFSCQDIIHLRLRQCVLESPSTLRGFQSLKYLDIQNVTLTQHVFEDLFVCCPMLKELTFKDCDGFEDICINAPNLRFLNVDVSQDLSFQNTLNLTWVYIHYTELRRLDVGSSGNLLKFFNHVPNISDLQLTGYALKNLAVGGPLLVKLPQPLLFLDDLGIEVNFTDVEAITTALCLIRSSPALENLHIWVYPAGDDDDDDVVVGEADSWFEKLGNNLDCQLGELRRIAIDYISGAKAELDFIKFLLLSSPVLECMTIEPGSQDNSLELLKKLVRLRRASVQAEIIILDP